MSVDGRLTEARNPRTRAIDRATTRDLVDLIQNEDRDVADAVATQADVIAAVIDAVVESFNRGGRLIYVGAGTSGRLGTLDASECPPTFGVDPWLVQAVIAGGPAALRESSEGAEDVAEDGAAAIVDLEVADRDYVLGIAASGTTPYVHGALRAAAAAGAQTGLLSCATPPDGISGIVDHCVVPLVGPEVIAGSTRLKAGTATKLVLNTITTGAMIRTGRVYENLMVDLRARSAKLVDRAVGIVMTLTGRERDAARSLLAAAGGGAKTALAMDALGVDRARAERLLDSVDGFVAAALDRYRGNPDGYYSVYPESPESERGAELLDSLNQASARVASAVLQGAATDAKGRRVSVAPGGWNAVQHAAHLLEFEREAVRPRVEMWAAQGTSEAFPDWETSGDPSSSLDLDETLDAFQAERAATLRTASSDGLLTERARVGTEIISLYQFLRGIDQHDRAHALRIRERVHPNLLVGEATS